MTLVSTLVIEEGGGGSAPIETTSTLNGDTATLTVYEDTDTDGTADLTESFTLTGGTETFTPSTLTLASGSEVWWAASVSDDSDIETALTQLEVTINAQ